MAKGPQIKLMGLKEPEERNGKPIGIMRNGKQVRMGWKSLKEGTK